MRWRKLGLVWGPDRSLPWAQDSALTPTPVLISPHRIRVYAGMRDCEGISRIAYVDVSSTDPTRVLDVALTPALDVGEPGMFDDNGVILGDVVRWKGTWWMFYVGFQLVHRAKFLAFSGLATSVDGESFTRVSATPVMDRADEGRYIRAIHSVHPGDDLWKVWYAAGNGWETIAGKPYPRYEIRYVETQDPIRMPGSGELCLAPTGREYRIGRPRVRRNGPLWEMLYTRGTLAGDYIAGFARSSDGRVWVRADESLGLRLSADGWDSRSLSYPAVIEVANETYAFYNGNDMGRDGFGVAVMERS